MKHYVFGKLPISIIYINQWTYNHLCDLHLIPVI